jgi:peptidoglycan/LPS O-acetylase OafA/YrhL
MFPMGMGVDLFFLVSGFIMVLTTQGFERGLRRMPRLAGS